MVGYGASKTPPKRPRNSWFLGVIKVEGSGAEVIIHYKTSRGKVGPQSRSSPHDQVQIPWGSVIKCEYKLVKEGENTVGEFHFTNKKGDVCKKGENILNMFNGGVNPFAKFVTGMIVENRQECLAEYLSLVPHAAEFVNHVEEIHTQEGFTSDGTGFTERDLAKHGGYLEELRDFRKAALESASVIAAPVSSSDVNI